jgi:hypothetical protein
LISNNYYIKTDETPEKEVGTPERTGMETRKYIETIKDCFAEEE